MRRFQMRTAFDIEYTVAFPPKIKREIIIYEYVLHCIINTRMIKLYSHFFLLIIFYLVICFLIVNLNIGSVRLSFVGHLFIWSFLSVI